MSVCYSCCNFVTELAGRGLLKLGEYLFETSSITPQVSIEFAFYHPGCVRTTLTEVLPGLLIDRSFHQATRLIKVSIATE